MCDAWHRPITLKGNIKALPLWGLNAALAPGDAAFIPPLAPSQDE